MIYALIVLSIAVLVCTSIVLIISVRNYKQTEKLKLEKAKLEDELLQEKAKEHEINPEQLK